MHTDQVLWLENKQIRRWVPLTASGTGSQNQVQIIPHEKCVLYCFMTSNHLLLLLLFLSNFVHNHKAVPVGFHSSVYNLKFAIQHTLSAGKPQRRVRQEVQSQVQRKCKAE